MSNTYSIGDTLVSDLFDEENVEHSGILGMRWGIRRYQNEDGTLTEAGKIRYYGKDAYIKSNVESTVSGMYELYKKSEEFKTATKEQKESRMKEFRKIASDNVIAEVSKIEREFKEAQDINKYAIDRINTGKQVLESSSGILNNAANLVPNVKGKESHPSYEGISTEDLRKRTERLNAENNYARAAGQMIYTPSKEELTRERLQTIGAVLSIAGGVVGGIVLPIARHYQGSGAPGADSGGKKKG